MSQLVPMWCCCSPSDCCDLWDCVTVCDDYEVEVTWREIWRWPNGQSTIPTEVRYTYTTGGTRSTYGTVCEGAEASYGYKWSEVTMDVSWTRRIYIGEEIGTDWCLEAPGDWQENADVYPSYLLACAGCDDSTYQVKKPDADFWKIHETYVYTTTHTFTTSNGGFACADGGVTGFTTPVDTTAPVLMTCVDDCGGCARLAFVFQPEEASEGTVLSDGNVYYSTGSCMATASATNTALSYVVQPWAVYSGCACPDDVSWKLGKIGCGFIDQHWISGIGLLGSFGAVESGPFGWEACGPFIGQAVRNDLSYLLAWACTRLEPCSPGNVYSYDEINVPWFASVEFQWDVSVTCL